MGNARPLINRLPPTRTLPMSARGKVTMRLSCLDLGSGAPLVHPEHLRAERPSSEREASAGAPSAAVEELDERSRRPWTGK